VRGADGRLTSEFRLWDVTSGKQLAGQRFTAGAQNWRRVGHLVADQVYERLTGEKGYFDTRVVFVDETGTKAKRVKRLAIMDQDGANVRLLSQGQELVLTPRFSPSTQEITYMSFGQGDPRVYLLNIETNQREVVGNFPGMTFSPRFSPDGRFVAFGSDESGTFEIYVQPFPNASQGKWMVSAGGGTEPRWSRDGKELFYFSGQALMAVPVLRSPSLSFGTPVKLFDAPIPSGYTNEGDLWQVAPDGKRFLFLPLAGPQPGPPVHVIVNWPALRKN